MAVFNIHRLSHVALNISNIDRAKEFYADMLGFVEVERNGSGLYLKGVEEGQHHSLVLRQGAHGACICWLQGILAGGS